MNEFSSSQWTTLSVTSVNGQLHINFSDQEGRKRFLKDSKATRVLNQWIETTISQCGLTFHFIDITAQFIVVAFGNMK